MDWQGMLKLFYTFLASGKSRNPTTYRKGSSLWQYLSNMRNFLTINFIKNCNDMCCLNILFLQLSQPANIGPQEVPSTSPSNVPRTSPIDPIWPSQGRPDLTSGGHPNLTSRGCPKMTSRELLNLTLKGRPWEVDLRRPQEVLRRSPSGTWE